MRLPTFKRLSKNDYAPEEQGFIEKLAFIINNSFEVIYEALNNKLSLRDNLACSVREILVTVDETGKPTKSVAAQFTFNTSVEGVVVLSAFNTVNANVVPNAAVFVSYTISNSSVLITNVTGLQPNVQYRVKIAVFGQ